MVYLRFKILNKIIGLLMMFVLICFCLPFIGYSLDVDSLIEKLSDKRPTVRINAAFALGEMGDPRAVGPLVVSLEDENPYVRIAVANALGEIKDSRALEPLIGSLHDENRDVRLSIMLALWKITGQDCEYDPANGENGGRRTTIIFPEGDRFRGSA